MSEPRSLAGWVRRALPYLAVVLIIAAGYDAWVFGSRWYEAHEAQKAAIRQEAREARRAIQFLGGDGLKILDFYASPPSIRRGAQSLICYGVNAADRVRIEPAVEELHPAFTHCFQVMPRETTEYKLFAEDHRGHSVNASLTIRVR